MGVGVPDWNAAGVCSSEGGWRGCWWGARAHDGRAFCGAGAEHAVGGAVGGADARSGAAAPVEHAKRSAPPLHGPRAPA
eukprot:1384016-Rhodomonas_salina.1